MRFLLTLIVMLSLCVAASAGNSFNEPSLQSEVQRYLGAAISPYATSGCLPTVPVASLTFGAFACTAFVEDTQTPPRLIPVVQSSSAVALSDVNGAHWLAVCRDTTSAVSGWTRTAGSHYVRRQVTAQPANPDGCMIIAKATVAGSVITEVADYRIPSSYVTAKVYDFTDPLYGYTGTAASATTALEAALAAAPSGAVVQVPAGEFLLTRNVWVTRGNITLQGVGSASILKADPAFTQLVTARALVNFGYSQALGDVPVSNVVVSDLTLDGQSLTGTVFFDSVTNGRIARLMALNAGPTHGSIFVYLGQDITVEGNIVEGSAGPSFGDGIYFESVTRPKALYNVVSDVQRIGIVCEGATGAGIKSVDCLFEGNTVFNLHDATSPESNSAFWMENTNGGWIVNNRAYDLTNTPSADGSRGITLSIGSTGPAKFIVRNNHITDAQFGVVLNTDSDVSVDVDGLTIDHSEEADYIIGVQINRGYHVNLNKVHCGDNTYPNSASGCIVVDVAGGVTVDTISINSPRVADTSGGMGYAVDSADINVVSTGGTINVLNIHDAQRMRISMRQAAVDVTLSDSQVSHSALTYRMLHASSQLKVSNSTLAGAVALTPFWFGNLPGSLADFIGVTFVGVQTSQVNDGSALQYWRFTDCLFLTDSSLDFDGDHHVTIQNSRWNSYPDTGAITGNGSIQTLRLFVQDTIFENDTDVIPIQLDTVEPTEAVFTNIQRTATDITDMTAAIIQMGDPLTFAVLGVRPNSSVFFCSDCTKATPCAGTGNGALAKRINGAWDCD